MLVLWGSEFMGSSSCKNYDIGEQSKLSEESRDPRNGLCWNDQCDKLPKKVIEERKLAHVR